MYLLDTNVVSELRKSASGCAATRVVNWFAEVDAAVCFLSAISLRELQLGILLVSRRDASQGERLRNWLETQVLTEFSDRTLSVDARVALRCATLHVPNPRPERDTLIAATALVHGMTLVTRNVTDFRDMGLRIINPWEPDAPTS